MLVLKGRFAGAVRELNAAVVHSDLPTMKVEVSSRKGMEQAGNVEHCLLC